jgi:DNA-binding YbaB/EbfC family protein
MGKTKRRAPIGSGGGKSNQKNMMKQIQQMQAEMQRTQENLEEQEITGSAGGGAVQVVANGAKMLKQVTIDPDVIDEDDVEMLEDLIVAAVNDAMGKVDEMANSEMGKLTGGMNIPGLM